MTPQTAAQDPQAPTRLAPVAGAHPAIRGPEVINGWTLERKLGAGAMGEVFYATREGRAAALKVVTKRLSSDDGFTQRFQREIAVLSKLNHPNVATALDCGELDGRPWLAMEFVDGPNLDDLLRQHGPFFEADVLQLAIEVARGLEHIHARAGLIHRDVKPANILIARIPGGDPKRLMNPGDRAKLIDFGLAKPVEQSEGLGLTMTGMIMGTPNYIAPEQIACEKTLTLHVDMYALGATVYHLLTGKLPYIAGSAAAVMAAHLNSPPPDPGQQVPALSQATRKLVLTALAKRAADRFTDWNAFVIACERALGGLNTGSSKMIKKPMVRPATTVVARSVPAEAPSPPPRRPETRRVETGKSDSSSGVRVGSGPTAAKLVADALEPRSPASGADALRAVVTSRISKAPTTATHRHGPPPQTHGGTSAVHKWSGRMEVAGTTGGSVLPWIVLTVASLGALVAGAWAAFFQ